ncbi:MAG: hypothetical protein HY926_01435 [Elusimicrobia bacterium]|nr:hypothetical protein [Elusimicrobiota bacterium]
MSPKGLRRLGLASAASALCLALPVIKALGQTNSLCAVVKLEIKQQATLEREGFDAHLVIENNVIDQPLTSLKVQIYFKDAEGNPADQSFFVKVATLTGTNAVDGTGVVQSSGTADIHWLIIPAAGAGGNNPAGHRYGVSALITSVSNGAPQSVKTFDAYITVHPQPLIKLEYALPYEVFGDEPMTEGSIEPVEPFPLAARVTNIGYGAANNFQIESAQPKIVENKQGLLVDFKLIGTQVGGKTIPDTLLIPFGDIQPGAVSQASWLMTATLSGRFISFTSTFSHAAELGGQLTSLMQSVTTYTLLRDVLVDLPGRDQVPDYLVNTSMDREAMQDLLNSGSQPPAELILESDQAQPLPVTEVPGSLSGGIGGTSAALTYTMTGAVGSNIWVHSYAPWPYGKNVVLAYAKRGDGKLLNTKNVWISKHFRKSDLSTIYWINILDLTGSTNTYTLQFDPAGLDLPPGAVTDLAAATYPSGGSLALSWSSPGEDGYTGQLFGGHVFIDAQLSSAAAFSPANSQVRFATSAAAGGSQTYLASGFIGNATYYAAIFIQDTGGGMSGLSNLATAYTLPNPPLNLAISSVSAFSIAANWQVGNNSLPVTYSLGISTAMGGAIVAASPPQDSFNRSYTFTGLLPGTTYFIYGSAKNPDSSVTSPFSFMGSTQTLPGPRDALPPRTALAVNSPSATGADNVLIVGRVSTFTLTSLDDALAVGDGTGMGTAFQVLAVDGMVRPTFTNPSPAPGQVFASTFSLASEADGLYVLAYHGEDSLGNREDVHLATVAVDNTPPAAVLTSPSSACQGLCGVVKGRLDVRGSAADEHLAYWSLEVSSGADYALISSGTAASSGTLAVWDTVGLTGWQTLRLTAVDAVLNVAVATASVFLGEPSATLILGDNTVFNKPAGVAVGMDGKIYAADANNDRVAVFSATGTFLASFTGFKKPKAVAVDASGSIFVADTNGSSLVKLSTSGQILMAVGRTKKKNEGFIPGSGSGEFNKPQGVALDEAGNIYVSDTNNHRVQKLGPDGSFKLAFQLPPAPAWSGDEDDGADSSGLGRPVGIALDAAGNIYTADQAGSRILKFDPAGLLLASFGVGITSSPLGVAVSSSGDCLFASDSGHDRILRFDASGELLLEFSLGFNKPAGLAFDAGQSLFVADRNNNRIVKIGAPAGQAAKVVSGGEKNKTVKGRITKQAGGRLDREDKAAVLIPAQALAEDLEITISSPVLRSELEEALKARKLGQASLVSVSTGVEYGPEGTVFNAPVTLVLPYDPVAVSAAGLREADLKVHYWNRDRQEWEVLTSIVDAGGRVVMAQTMHFSLYEVLGSGSGMGVAAAADEAFGYRDVYAFPNPARRSNPVIRTQVGLADSVDVNIYDIAGKLVGSGSLTGSQVLDDGNGKGPQYTYDYLWDTSNVGSGVYIYAVTARKAGYSPIRKQGKVGILK